MIANTAIIDRNVKIGKNTKIWHWTHIESGVEIKNNCIIGEKCYIGKEVKIGNNVKIQNNVNIFTGVIIEDNVFIGPGVTFTNVKKPRSEYPIKKSDFVKTRIKKGASIGAGAIIICGIEVGDYSFIGAGSVVTKNVCNNKLVIGNPARIKGYICECGEILRFNMCGNILFFDDNGYNYAICEKCKNKYLLDRKGNIKLIIKNLKKLNDLSISN